MTEERWNYIEYLKIFGFLAYQMGNPVTDEPNRLIVVEEMKDNFYFLLKSRKNRKLLSVYDEWEKIITGFMYYYGFIETRTLYSLFLKVSKKVISYEDFLLFIKCRTSLWPFGAILKDTFEEALDTCVELARPGDAVLLSPACASWGMFPNYEVRGEEFKKYVNALKKK